MPGLPLAAPGMGESYRSKEAWVPLSTLPALKTEAWGDDLELLGHSQRRRGGT